MRIGFPILFIALFIIFSQSLVVAGPSGNGSDANLINNSVSVKDINNSDANSINISISIKDSNNSDANQINDSVSVKEINDSGMNLINVSVFVKDINGNAIHDALIRGTDTSGNTVCKLTDTTGRADLMIANNSAFNLTADGYRDLVSTGPIVPGMVIINLQQSEPKNAIFHVVDQKRNDISGAFVIIEDSLGNEVVKRTDAKGIASVQLSLGRANVTIKTEEYSEFNDPKLMISGNTTHTYCLKDRISSWIITSELILLILPILFMLGVIVTKSNRWYLPALVWIFSFIIFLGINTFVTKNYEIYFFDPDLKVSLFVPIIAFIGAISYVTVSIINNIETKPSPEDWKRIRCAYGRRLLMAPYIAIIALFTIFESVHMTNPWAILFFAYFVGLYTKLIEGTLKEIGMKFLTKKQKIELSKIEMGSSDIVRQLNVSIGIAHKLDALGISKIDDLAAIRPERINEIAEKAVIDKAHLTHLMDRSKKRIQDIETMEKDLGLGSNLVRILVDREIYSKEDLIRINDNCIKEIAEKAGIDETHIKSLIEKS